MIDRRTFCRAVAVSVTGTAACSRQDTTRTETARDGLVRLLGLRGSEVEWLSVLSQAEQDELHAGLRLPFESGTARSERISALLMKLLGRRDRLFAYVGYPQISASLEGCDGLIRE